MRCFNPAIKLTIAAAGLPVLMAASMAIAQSTASECDEMLKWLRTLDPNSEEYAVSKGDYYEKCSTSSAASGGTGQNATDACTGANENNLKVKTTCNGQVSVSTDANGCAWYKCGQMQECQKTSDVLVNEGRGCLNKGGVPSRFQDERGCWFVKCVERGEENHCTNTPEMLKKHAADCTARGGNASTVQDDKGCWWMKCAAEELKPVACKKLGCAVRCEDGTSFNACQCADTSAPKPPPSLMDKDEMEEDDGAAASCKTSRVRNCTITRCSDGTVKRECTKQVTSPTINRVSRRFFKAAQ